MIKRRAFITLLGGAAAWPLAAPAQQSAKLPTIGFLGADASNWSLWTAAFAARLRELGWSEGRTIAIEYRWSEGRAQNAAEIAAEFVRERSLSQSASRGQNHDLEFSSTHDRYRSRDHRGHPLWHMALSALH